MKLDKKIREMSWPKKFEGSSTQDFKVTGSWVICNHERLLVLTFTMRPVNWYERKDFRVIISKKRKDFAVLIKGETRQRRLPLSKVAPKVHFYSRYPNIDKKTEDMIHSITGQTSNNHQMDTLNEWTLDITENRKKAARTASGAFEDEDVYLCPDELPEGLTAWIRDEVLPNDKTIIYKKGGMRGTCALCGNSFRKSRNEKMRQHTSTTCPDCGEKALAILENSAAWKADYVKNVMALQKGKDGTVWFRHWHILRDNTAQYEKGIENHLREIARYGIRGRKVGMWVLEAKEGYCGTRSTYPLNNWKHNRAIYTYDGGYEFFSGGIAEAAEGSILQYADLEGYFNDTAREYTHDIMKYAMDFARYPVMEYLWKAGYRRLVHQKVGRLSKDEKDLILWQRTKLTECFRFPIRMLKCMKAKKWGMSDIKLMSALWEHKDLSEKEILTLFKIKISPELISSVSKYAGTIKTINYLEKQLPEGGRSDTVDIARTYRDYIAECEKLELDLTQSDVLFPKDLQAAHERTMQMIVFKQNAAIQERFDKQIDKLKKWTWENGGLIIRPANSQGELIEEGKALHHCVGGYADRMASGQTAIFLIRKAADPDTPFYTLELQNKRVVQCRTKNNKSYEDDIKEFVDKWLAKVVNSSKTSKPKSKSA